MPDPNTRTAAHPGRRCCTFLLYSLLIFRISLLTSCTPTTTLTGLAMAHEQAAAGLELDRDEVDVDISGFRQGSQVARIRGENIVAVGGQAHHGGVNRIPLATAGQQQPRPAPSGSSIAATSVPASSRATGTWRPRPPRQTCATTPPLVTGTRPASRSRFTSATTPRSPRPPRRTPPHPGPASGRTLATGPPALAPGLRRAAHHDRPAACTAGSLPHLLLGDLTMFGLVPRQELI